MLLTIGAFIVVLSVLITVHELGHLLAAKAVGIAAPRFSLGFGKRLWGFHWGETDQSIPLDKAKEVAAAHKDQQHFFYPAGHGFNCDQRGSYNADSSKLAKSRSLEFLRKHVG